MEEQGKQQEIEIEEVTAQENVIAVRDLVPMRAAMDDSMERIADMKDQFHRRSIRSCACTMRRCVQRRQGLR